MPDIIPGLKVIRHNVREINLPDEPSFPFKLEANFRPPEFMKLAFILMYGGSEEIFVRSMTKESLNEFVERNGLRTNSRLWRLTITGPDGIVEQLSYE